MFDDKEALEQLERHRWHSEKIERRDNLAVIGQEGMPTLARIPAPPESAQIPGNGSFGDVETQLHKFSVDFGRSPSRIFFRQAPD